MKLYRYKRNGQLYLLYKVNPPRQTGSYYEAVGYSHHDVIKNVKLKDFVLKYNN